MTSPPPPHSLRYTCSLLFTVIILCSIFHVYYDPCSPPPSRRCDFSFASSLPTIHFFPIPLFTFAIASLQASCLMNVALPLPFSFWQHLHRFPSEDAPAPTDNIAGATQAIIKARWEELVRTAPPRSLSSARNTHLPPLAPFPAIQHLFISV